MKKFLVTLIVVLLVWNSYLTYEVNQLKSVETTPTGTPQQVNNNTINGYTSDLTNVIKNTESKVVGITTSDHGALVATGSGVIYSSDEQGVFIVTNYHVIKDATEYMVTFDNGEVLPSELVGFDEVTDIVVLKVNPSFEVEPFNHGETTVVKKGEYVVALGSMVNNKFQGTATFGIVSALDVTVPIDSDDDGNLDWEMLTMQIDAEVNYGNSGGPLINLSGDLIGITTMKAMGDGNNGMAYAIPMNEITPIVEQIKEHGEVIRPVIGIRGRDIKQLTIYQKSYLGIPLDQTKGVLVTEVLKDSPASDKGIMKDDIVIQLAGNDIDSFKTYRQVLYGLTKGEEVEIVLSRNNQEIKTTVLVE